MFSRPTSASRRKSSSAAASAAGIGSEYECKASYLVIVDDVDEPLTSANQLKNALAQSGRNVPKKRLQKYWTDDTESMTFAEFCDICNKEPATTEDDLLKAFKKIDINGDGFITNNELRKTLTTRGDRMSADEVQDIIDEVDENKDGKLNYNEFCTMLLGTQEKAKKLALKRMEKKMTTKGTQLKTKPSPRRRDSGVEDSDDDDDDIVVGSRISLSSTASKTGPKPKPRPRTNGVTNGDDDSMMKADLPAGRSTTKERILPAVASHNSKLKRPRRLSEWKSVVMGGQFFLDTETNEMISHQYSLTLPKETSVWITVEPKTIGNMIERPDPVDTQMLVMRKDGSLVTFTELRYANGKYGVRCDLEQGEYSLIPMTSGCRLRPREREPSVESKLLRKKGDKFVLSKGFREALGDIFKMCDLDGDGLLSREEFNLFNLRTSGEGVVDEEWEVVEDNVDLEGGKITEEGFITLNQMEADDNEGDTDDLWMTLTCMGYNKSLQVDQGCPYTVEVYAEDGDPKLRVIQIESIDDLRDKAMTEATIAKGEASKVKHMRDLHLHSLITDVQATYVLENKSHSRVTVDLDCSQSRNCISHQASLSHSVEIPRGQSKLVHYMMPINESRDWSISCVETVIK